MKRFIFIFSLILSLFFVTNLNVYAAVDSDYNSHNRFDAPISLSNAYDGPFTQMDIYSNANSYPIIFYRAVNWSSRYFRVMVNYPFLPNYTYSVSLYTCQSNFNQLTTQTMQMSHSAIKPKYSVSDSPISEYTWPSGTTWVTNYYCFKYDYVFSYEPVLSDDTISSNAIFGFYRSSLPGQFFFIYSLEINNMGLSNQYHDSYYHLIISLLEQIKQDSDIGSKLDELNKNQQEQMKQEQQNHDEMMNANPDSSFNEDTSSFDDFDNSQNDLMNSIDVDTSDISFDVDSYSNPFKWIWETLTAFISVNSKIIGCITSVLILSFVGLVVGRG